MNKGNLVVLLLLLLGGGTLAAVYKWVDESGRVHYGDSPPPQSDVQSVEVPEGPTQEEIERARQQMQEKIEQYEGLSEEISPPEHTEKSSQQAATHIVILDDVACFSQLSEVIQGPSSETYTPIKPTALSKTQKKTLLNLFNRMEAFWRGKITDLTCMGSSSDPRRKITNYEARTTIDWDSHVSRLTLETDSVGRETHAVERLFQRFEVGDALYFTDYKQADIIALEGNKVEVLNIAQNIVSFITKRHIPTGSHARRPRAEVRHLEISGRTLKLVELYYHNEMLTGSRVWALDR